MSSSKSSVDDILGGEFCVVYVPAGLSDLNNNSVHIYQIAKMRALFALHCAIVSQLPSKRVQPKDCFILCIAKCCNLTMVIVVACRILGGCGHPIHMQQPRWWHPWLQHASTRSRRFTTATRSPTWVQPIIGKSFSSWISPRLSTKQPQVAAKQPCSRYPAHHGVAVLLYEQRGQRCEFYFF